MHLISHMCIHCVSVPNGWALIGRWWWWRSMTKASGLRIHDSVYIPMPHLTRSGSCYRLESTFPLEDSSVFTMSTHILFTREFPFFVLSSLTMLKDVCHLAVSSKQIKVTCSSSFAKAAASPSGSKLKTRTFLKLYTDYRIIYVEPTASTMAKRSVERLGRANKFV